MKLFSIDPSRSAQLSVVLFSAFCQYSILKVHCSHHLLRDQDKELTRLNWISSLQRSQMTALILKQIFQRYGQSPLYLAWCFSTGGLNGVVRRIGDRTMIILLIIHLRRHVFIVVKLRWSQTYALAADETNPFPSRQVTVRFSSPMKSFLQARSVWLRSIIFSSTKEDPTKALISTTGHDLTRQCSGQIFFNVDGGGKGGGVKFRPRVPESPIRLKVNGPYFWAWSFNARTCFLTCREYVTSIFLVCRGFFSKLKS